ncbi:MAG: ABC transporter ATP-binding protein [Fimbriimonadaceae bacterium]|nr:ABC transporter ATP-binding protein [Fimbriimonadaceae bacterium]QYK56881.1 MAG: ABC transporter ATP-binding protein [Fimbriimonadaceae bacterium]
MIEVSNASLVYKDQGRKIFACRELDLEVRDGEFLGILGPSGSGKSSLLYLMSALKVPTSGDVRYKGRSLTEMSESQRANLRLTEFGFVFQYPYLLGYLSALENIVVGTPGPPRRKEAIELLESLGLAHKSHRLPHELSGGERQRVCIARAVLGDRSCVFADEPTANLDHENGHAVVDMLVALRGKGSLVMVTHDPEMLQKADRIIRIRDGRLDEDTAIPA